MEKFKAMLKEAVGKHSEKDGAEYKAFFAKQLKAAGADSIDDLSDEKKKAFFAKVDKLWKADHEA